ncbi:hypothetical protein ACHAQJ_008506 [Trichoderma viride]
MDALDEDIPVEDTTTVPVRYADELETNTAAQRPIPRPEDPGNGQSTAFEDLTSIVTTPVDDGRCFAHVNSSGTQPSLLQGSLEKKQKRPWVKWGSDEAQLLEKLVKDHDK